MVKPSLVYVARWLEYWSLAKTFRPTVSVDGASGASAIVRSVFGAARGEGLGSRDGTEVAAEAVAAGVGATEPIGNDGEVEGT